LALAAFCGFGVGDAVGDAVGLRVGLALGLGEGEAVGEGEGEGLGLAVATAGGVGVISTVKAAGSGGMKTKSSPIAMGEDRSATSARSRERSTGMRRVLSKAQHDENEKQEGEADPPEAAPRRMNVRLSPLPVALGVAAHTITSSSGSESIARST
jgi:hypothetical protein